MSFDVSVGKYCPLRRVFPPIIPGGLGELRASTIDGLDRGDVTDTVLIRSKADDRTVLLMKSDILMFKATVA
jgi:hypothetical protein